MSKSIYTIILTTIFVFISCSGKSLSPKIEPIKGALGTAIEIPLGGFARIESENLTIEFCSVLEDNRCPGNVTCVWPGIASIELKVLTNENDTALFGVSLHGLTSDAVIPNELSVDTLGFLFTLVTLDPYPEELLNGTQSNIRATLRILRTGDDAPPNPAIVTDKRLTELKMDEFDVDTVSISGKTITLDVVYGGGCKTHYFSLYMIDFFIMTGIVMVELYLVHFNNDDFCEALVHNTLSFDISPVINRYIEWSGEDEPIILEILDYEQTHDKIFKVLYTPPE